MIKMVNLLDRKEGLSHEEFVERWRGSHAEMAADLPGLQRYVTSVPRDPERAAYDGIVELWFEDSAAMSDAFESEVGRAVQADAAEFADVEAGPTMVVEEQVHVGER